MTHSPLLRNCRMKMLGVLLSGFLVPPSAYAVVNVTVMADRSASLAVTKLTREYAKLSGVGVAASFLDKADQAVQIAEGGAADVLITQDLAWIELLQQQGLVDVHSKQFFGVGRLALVGPEDAPAALAFTPHINCAALIHAMGGEPALYLANPEYIPEAKYGRSAMRYVDPLGILEPYSLYLRSMDEMVDQVTTQRAYAVLPYGDALLLEHAKIIDVFPPGSTPPMPYYAVVLAGDNMPAAREFIEFLSTDVAGTMIQASGMEHEDTDVTPK